MDGSFGAGWLASSSTVLRGKRVGRAKDASVGVYKTSSKVIDTAEREMGFSPLDTATRKRKSFTFLQQWYYLNH